MRRPYLFVATALVTALVGGSLAWWLTTPPPRPAVTASGEALIGGPFALIDQNGREVSDRDFAGRFTLVFFGFTYCPDMCPLSLMTMSAAMDELAPEEAERVVPIFVTLDPERDTVELIADYAALFHPRLVALTGERAAIDDAARAYRVYHARAEMDSGEDYLIDHSAFTYLMGPDGRYRTHFTHDVTPDALAERIRAELRAG
jgi:cytochrome oxidase Cu insertion factor (SCO1/SenC/PrrC family)